MKDELWMKKIKQRLEDYSEPLPDDGWKRLEKELSTPSAPPTVKRRIIPFRRWSVSAAAVLLVAVSSVSIWFALSPASHEMKQISTSAWVAMPDEQPRQAPASTPSAAPEVAHYSAEKKLPTKRKNLLAQQQDVPTANEPTNNNTNTEINNQPPQEKSNDTKVIASKKEYNEEKGVERRRTASKNRLSAPIESRKKKSNSWSVGLSVGNTNGLALNDASQGNSRQNAPGLNYLGSGGKIDLASTADGILAIPEGTDVIFKEGLPYLLNRKQPVASMEHKQPISVGLSIRKQLSNGLSVETGLTYTHLASDVKFDNSPEKISQKLHYVGIPVRANWNFVDKKSFIMYVSAGGAVEKCVYGKLGNEDETVKPLQLSVMGAIGAQVNLSKRIGIYVEPGVSYFFDDGSSVQTIRKENPCNFTLQGGIRLTY